MESKQKALLAGNFAADKKAKRIVILEMKKLMSITDYFVICSGTSSVHLEAVTDGIVEGLAKERVKPLGIEGSKFLNWILVDYGDIIVHVFRDEAREFYRLEKLWGDARRIERKQKLTTEKTKRKRKKQNNHEEHEKTETLKKEETKRQKNNHR